MRELTPLGLASSKAYHEIQDMIDNLVRNDSAEERAKIADRAKVRMSDYSSLRYRMAVEEAKAETGR